MPLGVTELSFLFVSGKEVRGGIHNVKNRVESFIPCFTVDDLFRRVSATKKSLVNNVKFFVAS